MPLTEAQRRATAAHEAKLRAAGGSKVTLRLGPEATTALTQLTEKHGSPRAAAEFALIAAARPQANKPEETKAPKPKRNKSEPAPKPRGYDKDDNPVY